jgi:hypothetical protein
MRQARKYRGVDRNYFYSSRGRQSSQPGPAALRAGSLLAVLSLSFGIALAAFVPASLEQRIGSLFFFGLIPAIGFYAGGHILSQLFVLSSELCNVIAARCLWCVAVLITDLMNWAGLRVSNSLAKLPTLRQRVYYSVHRCYCHVNWAIVDFCCLLIRSIARFIIRMQSSRQERLVTYRKVRALGQ